MSKGTFTQKKFEALRTELLEKAKAKSACADQYRRAAKAEATEDLLKVVYDNLAWCSDNLVVSNEWLNKFPADILLASGCASTGKENTGLANSGDRNSGDSNSGYRNSGDSNSGSWNSGDSNSGSWNSGYRNSGYRNSGSWNSGDRNSGDRNSGSWNSGDSNSGSWNSGYRNSGYRNSGDSNSGSWNSGSRNSGDSNSGYRKSGAFCTENNSRMELFDKPCKSMTVLEWEQSKAIRLMNSIEPTMWVPSSMMSKEEKAAHPNHETTEGYLKTIPIKDAWKNAWGNWSEENRKVFTSLENFDSDKFFEITGIRV